MMRHILLLFSVLTFCYYTDSCSFKTQHLADNVLKLNQGNTITHLMNGYNISATSGYTWTAVVDNPEIISIEAGLPNEIWTQMDPSQFNFKIKGKHKGHTRIHFQYKKTGQTNMAPRRIEVIEIEVS